LLAGLVQPIPRCIHHWNSDNNADHTQDQSKQRCQCPESSISACAEQILKLCQHRDNSEPFGAGHLRLHRLGAEQRNTAAAQTLATGGNARRRFLWIMIGAPCLLLDR
jgi:hypothetical protein